MTYMENFLAILGNHFWLIVIAGIELMAAVILFSSHAEKSTKEKKFVLQGAEGIFLRELSGQGEEAWNFKPTDGDDPSRSFVGGRTDSSAGDMCSGCSSGRYAFHGKGEECVEIESKQYALRTADVAGRTCG